MIKRIIWTKKGGERIDQTFNRPARSIWEALTLAHLDHRDTGGRTKV